MWCCATPEREVKSGRIMRALAKGWPGGRFIVGEPPNNQDPFITWGQVWLAETLIAEAIRQQRRFFQIDNGFYKSARGQVLGYYRFMYSRPNPIFFEDAKLRLQRTRQLMPPLKPWRKTGKHILLAVPGPDFGRPFGFDCVHWHNLVYDQLHRITDRPIRVRPRLTAVPLEQDLEDCWAVVTHSSNVGFDAVTAGIPVFVERTSMAYPVGNKDFSTLEDPLMPDRTEWLMSLMCQQFTIAEMQDGTAYRYLSVVMRQVEAQDLSWKVDMMYDSELAIQEVVQCQIS